MPPKRKLRSSTNEEQSPPAKRTRGRGVLVETQPEANGSGRVTRSRTASDGPKVTAKHAPVASKSTIKTEKPQRTRSTRANPKQPSPSILETSEQEEHTEDAVPIAVHNLRGRRGHPPGIRANAIEVEEHPSPSRSPKASTRHDSDEESPKEPPRRRGRAPRGNGRGTSTRKGRAPTPPPLSQASSSKVTLEQTEPLQDESDGELRGGSNIIIDSMRTRLATPSRNTAIRTFGTPRHIVEVVVNTPSRQIRNAAVSGTPSICSTVTRSVPSPGTIRQVTVTSQSVRLKTTEVLGNAVPPFAESELSESEDEVDVHEAPLLAVASADITIPVSPSDRGAVTPIDYTSTKLPTDLYPCLDIQKRAVLRRLRSMPVVDVESFNDGKEEYTTNDVAFEQLCGLLRGTIDRGEGNSCFLTGPRGSGKTQLVEQAISILPERPIVVRLSGHVQTNDRLAMREIARQLAEQSGKSLIPADPEAFVEDDEENPFLDTNPDDGAIALPPPAHLLALISMIPTLPRPTIIIIDAIDLFALHARQALLYCLFDTAQSCRAGMGTKGVAIVGVTARIDTINMLEKRVKSRFSGRILRSACPRELKCWTLKLKAVLCTRVEGLRQEWSSIWEKSINAFVQDETVKDIFEETFALTRDVRVLNRMLIPSILALKPSVPFLTSVSLRNSMATQRCPARFPSLATLAYPSICLLIAAMHARTSGHDIFTFEMLYEVFRDHVRATQSVPVQVEGGGIGMVSCDRDVLMGACEQLVALRIFMMAATTTVGTAKGFVRYRCALDRAEVKDIVTQMGQLNLRKWFSKS